jgi:AcrR family transcriptional regulator
MITKEDARRAILEAAMELFDRYGPIKTSIADIARRIGMSPANIYNFYPSRDAIVEAAGALRLATLTHQIAADLRTATDDWTKLRMLFLNTSAYLRARLLNETDILHLQTLERKYQWQFIASFQQFLRDTAQASLRHGMALGAFRPMQIEAATEALFDCMTLAIDPLAIVRSDRADHERRVSNQLDLLERAFRSCPAPGDDAPRALHS